MKYLKQIFRALTKAELITFVACGVIAVVSGIIAVNFFVTQATTVVPAAGGSVDFGIVGQPEYVNPVNAQSDVDRSLVKLVYSNLDDLADSIEQSADGRTWTVRLKENLHWQDGEPLTSDDVVFTVQSIQNPDADSPLYSSWQGIAVSRDSELQVSFSLANPYAFFPDNLKNLYILPKHIFGSTPPGNWHLSDYNLKPVGSGPYEFDSYDRRSDGSISSYNLKSWNGFPGNKPLISNLNFQFFNNTPDMIKNFNLGGIDAMGGLYSDDLTGIQRPYNISSWPTSGYYAVFFNQSRNLALQDEAVREALSAAAPRDTIVENSLGGYGSAEYGPIPPGAPYFVPTPSTSSLEVASDTLTAAGWTTGSDGFRSKMIKNTSVHLAFTLTVPQVGFLTDTANSLADAWKSVGMNVTVSEEDPQSVINDPVKNRDYEALLFGNILGPSSDLYAFWDSSERFSPGLNLSIYSNNKVDSLIEGARMELDVASRTAEFAQAENLIAANFPAIFLYSPDYLLVTSKSLQGVKPSFITDPADIFYSENNWYLNTARVLK